MSGTDSRSPALTEAEKAAFVADGAVCLRQRFDMEWVTRLRQAGDEVLAGQWSTVNFTPPERPGRFTMSLFLWRLHPVFREFIFDSPAAAIAGELLGATKINLLHDKLLVKEPGTAEMTAWHQDVFFWPVQGTQICSVWVALDPVTRATGGVKFIAGSNKWRERYRPLMPDSPALAQRFNMHLPPTPELDESQLRVLQWDLEPGDCLAFDGVVMHGSGGNTSTELRRRAMASHWCGDDVTYVNEHFVLDLPASPGLATGDPLDSDLFPVVWRRGRP